MKAVQPFVLLCGHWLEGETHQLHIHTLNPKVTPMTDVYV